MDTVRFSEDSCPYQDRYAPDALRHPGNAVFAVAIELDRQNIPKNHFRLTSGKIITLEKHKHTGC